MIGSIYPGATYPGGLSSVGNIDAVTIGSNTTPSTTDVATFVENVIIKSVTIPTSNEIFQPFISIDQATIASITICSGIDVPTTDNDTIKSTTKIISVELNTLGDSV